MYGGNSGCYGIILYNTNIKGDNAVYGYYKGDDICVKSGTLEEMKAFRNIQEESVTKASDTKRHLVVLFLIYVVAIIAGFVVLPVKYALAILVFCIGSYFLVLIIKGATQGVYSDPGLKMQFRRNHGCEHAAINALTKGKRAEMDSFNKPVIYDSECGTAYSGYAVAVAIEFAALIILWPGLLKAIGALVMTVILLLVMILVPRINPFTLLQRPVVLPPTEKEYMLVIEIMKKLKELE